MRNVGQTLPVKKNTHISKAGIKPSTMIAGSRASVKAPTIIPSVFANFFSTSSWLTEFDLWLVVNLFLNCEKKRGAFRNKLSRGLWSREELRSLEAIVKAWH